MKKLRLRWLPFRSLHNNRTRGKGRKGEIVPCQRTDPWLVPKVNEYSEMNFAFLSKHDQGSYPCSSSPSRRSSRAPPIEAQKMIEMHMKYIVFVPFNNDDGERMVFLAFFLKYQQCTPRQTSTCCRGACAYLIITSARYGKTCRTGRLFIQQCVCLSPLALVTSIFPFVPYFL